MSSSINPYGYTPSMLAIVNASSAQEDQKPASSPVTILSHHKASVPPKTACPLLAAPYEIRAHILSYILPCTIPFRGREVIWRRGNTVIMSTCRKIYEECRRLFYGRNWFLIDIFFNRITFNYQWLIDSDTSQENGGRKLGSWYKVESSNHRMVPSRKIDFVCHFSCETRAFMKKFILRMHFVDGYEGMIKFNITNEQVLRRGLVTTSKAFKESVLPCRATALPTITFKLTGDEKQIELFKTRDTEMMEAIYPGWQLSLSPEH